MPSTRTILVVFAAAALLRGAPAAAPFRVAGFETTELPKVRVPLDRRRVRAAIPPVNASDFRLLEDGRPTNTASNVMKLRDTDLGLSLVVAIDASGSMKGRPMEAIRRGLAQMVSRKRDRDRVAVLSFADDLKWEARWDAGPAAVQEAFRKIEARGNQTRLYDAMTEAVSELTSQSGKNKEFPFRHCILLLSDGHDEGSQTTLDQLLTRLKGQRIRVDSIGLTRTPLWMSSMREISQESFGEFQAVPVPEKLTAILGKGIDLLLDLPVLEFSTSDLANDGNTHQIGVEQISSGSRDQLGMGLVSKSTDFFAPASGTKWLPWAGGGLAVVLAAALFLAAQRRPGGKASMLSAPAPLPSGMPSAAPAAPRAARQARMLTEAEFPRRSTAYDASPQPFHLGGGTSFSNVSAQASAAEAMKPVRSGTSLAPQPSSVQAPMNLRAIAGPYAGRRFPLDQVEFWIGSSDNNHLQVSEDAAVSGNHACIRREAQFYRLYDNKSLNDTRVNGNPVGESIVVLKNGDLISLGQSSFSFEACAPA